LTVLEEIVADTTVEEPVPEAPRAEPVDDRLSTLMSVVSQLAENMHTQQLHLDKLQEAFNAHAMHLAVAHTTASGAIPKRPIPGHASSCVGEVDSVSNVPDLSALREDSAAMAQATSMIKGLELRPTGSYLKNSSVRYIRWG
jgi:hypothetical protein